MFRRKRYPWPGHATVHEAIRFLASACDGAVRRDRHGFGADHVALGHGLAQLPAERWGPSEHHAGLQLVRIYRQQLQRAGFDPDAVLRGARPRRVTLKAITALQPGWYADPTGLHRRRWWNGARWTSTTDSSPSAVGPMSSRPTGSAVRQSTCADEAERGSR